MVQTLAALLSWIAMLALISIGVLLSGVWRPRSLQRVTGVDTGNVRQLQTAAQARAQAEAVARTKARQEDLRRAA